jgi:hypothetical protein
MEVEGEGDAGKVRRNPTQPLPDNSEESKKDVQARTAYAKGKNLKRTAMNYLHQCCGSETIFRIRIPFSAEFWIRIRILLD